MSNIADFIIENGILVKYVGKDTEVVIPDEVTSIGEAAFKLCAKLKRVIIPDSVTSIGTDAFYGCSALAAVRIPDSVTSIGIRAFYYCEALMSIVIPEGVTSIKRATFCGCKNLISIRLPAGLINIENEVFGFCKTLTSISFPNSLTSIGAWSFFGCESLESLTFPNSIECIGTKAFASCANLASVTFPDSVTRFEPDIFEKCRLQRLLTTKIKISFLKQTKFMTPATIGFLLNRNKFTNEAEVREYTKYALSHRKEILSEAFKNDFVEAVAYYADMGKINISNIEDEYLSPAMQESATQCLAYLLNWKNANISPEDEEEFFEQQLMKDPFNAADMRKLWSYKKLEDGTLSITGYKGDSIDITIPVRIGKIAVTAIEDRAFSPLKAKRPPKQAKALSALRSVTIPESITSIGENAFNGCLNLTISAAPGSAANTFAEENGIKTAS